MFSPRDLSNFESGEMRTCETKIKEGVGKFLATVLTTAILVLVGAMGFNPASAQTATRPGFPQGTPLDPKSAPASVIQHASMVRIPAGTYTIGAPADDSRSGADALPAHTLRIAAFRIDRTEVTTLQFAEFLNALPIKPVGKALGGAVSPANLARGDRPLFLGFVRSPYPITELDDNEALIGVDGGRFVPNPGYENHPVPEVTWGGAAAFCAWRGARLPTEVEWEAAARGMAGRPYPWGDEAPTPELAVIRRRSGDIIPVGSAPRGATPEGVLDMAGSLQEWTSTLYRPYPYRADDGREDLSHPGERVTRGGDYVFESAAEKLTTWYRTGFSRATRAGHRHIGFRCAVNE